MTSLHRNIYRRVGRMLLIAAGACGTPALAADPPGPALAQVTAACAAIEHDPRVFASLARAPAALDAAESLARDPTTPLRVRLCAIGLRGASPDPAAFALWTSLEGAPQREVVSSAVRAAALAHLRLGSLVPFVLAHEAHATDEVKRSFSRLLARDKNPRALALAQRLSASLSSAGAAARAF